MRRRKRPMSLHSTLPKFETEALFLQTIAGLLTRLPGVEGVQILQGPQEFGKDLVFWTTGPLGERLACACVLKRDRISGNASRSSGARTIFNQVTQALDSPYTDGSGQDVWIQRVYVLTPSDISPEAVNSVKGGLRNRAGQVVFMGGHELFSLFKKYWPDYYSDEAAALKRYIERMRSQLHQHGPLERLTAIYDLGNTSDLKRVVHVPLDLQRDLRDYKAFTVMYQLLLQDFEIREAQKLSKADLSHLHDRGQELRRLLLHLAAWEFCLLGREMNATLDHYIREIKKRWQSQKFVSIATLKSARDRIKLLIRDECKLLQEYEGQLASIKRQKIDDIDTFMKSETHRRVIEVDQCLSEYSSSEWKKTQVARSLILTGLQWRQSRGSILVAGEPGSGKTSFCKWNALQDIESYSTGESDVLPIYIPLQALAETDSNNISDLIATAAPFSAFLGDIHTQLKSGKFSRARLYCDGLDEVSTRELRASLIKTLRSGIRDQRFQIVVTTRDYVRGKELAWLPRFHMKSLDAQQLKNLCGQWLGEESVAVREFFIQLRADPSLAELVLVPLIATLTILVFRKTGRLPDNKGRLYSMFVELLAGGWDLAKGVLRPSRFGRDVKLIVLARLAERVHSSRRRVFGLQDIREAAAETFMQPEFDTRWEYFANELLEDGLLTLAGGMVFQFRHLSFQEYLTARELLSTPGAAKATTALEEFLRGESWWKEALDFYILLSGNPRELWSWAQESIRFTKQPANGQYIESSILSAYPKFKIPTPRLNPL